MSYNTIDALRESLARPAQKGHTPEYAAKMLHDVPEGEVVDRAAFILERCKGKRVLELGASGKLHEAIVSVAYQVEGIDREHGEHVLGFDLDDTAQRTMPVELYYFNPDIIVCGEVLEHLSNPGHCLARLYCQWPDAPLIVSVPNAFSSVGAKYMATGVENVNKDHVAWYSYRTLRTLLERANYEIDQVCWYHGEPWIAEGLIVVAKGR